MQLGFVCPVPINICTGGSLQSRSTKAKYHQSPADVHRCEGRYLQSQGYARLSNRTYARPGDGEVLMLSKKPGQPVRTGKGGGVSGKTMHGAGRPIVTSHNKTAW